MKPIIEIENLGKRYIIGHEQRQRYTALRDVITENAKNAWNRLRHPLGGWAEDDPQHEEFWALRDINLTIEQGERVGIIGRNGAGKSTLLKILSRITHPSKGRITLRGRVASLLEVGTGFHPELTGRENIYLNGSVLGMTRTEITRKFDEIVDFAGVEKFLDTPVKRYSSGMQVRLGFAVAAHLEPEILLVDEVLAVGDVEFQKKCLGKMEDVSQKEGRTVLFVSHNMGAVKQLCNHGILLESGRIEQNLDIESCIEIYLAQSYEYTGGCEVDAKNNSRYPGMLPIIERMRTYSNNEVRPTNFIKTGEDLVIELDYNTYGERIDLIQFGIDANDGTRVATVGNHLSLDTIPVITGIGTIRCRILELRLVEGVYYITPMMGKMKPRHNLDYIDQLIRFQVNSENYYGTGHAPTPTQGKIAQKSLWSLTKN